MTGVQTCALPIYRQPARRNAELRRVVARVENRIAERLAENFFEQLVHELAAAAMRHQDMWILRNWNRAACRKIDVVFHSLFWIYDI